MLFLLAHRTFLFITLVTQILFAPINYFYWALESRCTMTHFILSKRSFHACTYTIMFTLSFPCFKKAPGVSNTCLFVKTTQPIKGVYRFEIPYAPVWSNPMFYKWNPILFEWIINQPKAVLNKQCFVLTIITDIKMVFLDHIAWLSVNVYKIHVRRWTLDRSDNTHFVSLSKEQLCNSQQSLPLIALFLAQKPHQNA